MAAVYGLGEWSGTPQAVTGGLKHQLYHAQTSQGDYAVKVLNPRLLREPGRIEHYRQSEQIAQAAAQAGLPAVTALAGSDGPVQTVGPATVMVFPWLVGTTLPPAPASPGAAAADRRAAGATARLVAGSERFRAAKTNAFFGCPLDRSCLPGTAGGSRLGRRSGSLPDGTCRLEQGGLSGTGSPG